MVKKIFAQTYLWVLLLLLYSPIVIIVIYSFTEAKVLGNWTGFSTKLYSSLFNTGAHHSLMNALIMTGISEGFSAVLVGVVGFVILWLMERVWKRYGPIKTNKS